MPTDTSHETIKNIFYEQIRKLSVQPSKLDTFDIQFSERWVQ